MSRNGRVRGADPTVPAHERTPASPDTGQRSLRGATCVGDLRGAAWGCGEALRHRGRRTTATMSFGVRTRRTGDARREHRSGVLGRQDVCRPNHEQPNPRSACRGTVRPSCRRSHGSSAATPCSGGAPHDGVLVVGAVVVPHRPGPADPLGIGIVTWRPGPVSAADSAMLDDAMRSFNPFRCGGTCWFPPTDRADRHRALRRRPARHRAALDRDRGPAPARLGPFGWWVLLYLVPIGNIVLLVLLAQPSDERGARFDRRPDPGPQPHDAGDPRLGVIR